MTSCRKSREKRKRTVSGFISLGMDSLGIVGLEDRLVGLRPRSSCSDSDSDSSFLPEVKIYLYNKALFFFFFLFFQLLGLRFWITFLLTRTSYNILNNFFLSTTGFLNNFFALNRWFCFQLLGSRFLILTATLLLLTAGFQILNNYLLLTTGKLFLEKDFHSIAGF